MKLFTIVSLLCVFSPACFANCETSWVNSRCHIDDGINYDYSAFASCLTRQECDTYCGNATDEEGRAKVLTAKACGGLAPGATRTEQEVDTGY